MAFKFEWVKKNDGFDPNPATPWLMVPSDGYKEVALPGLKNSLTNFTWTCSGDIGWAPSGGDKLFIFGNKKTGLFRLEARNAAGEVAKLDVSVKKRWTYVIQAFVLHHAGGHVSKRSFGRSNAWFAKPMKFWGRKPISIFGPHPICRSFT